MFTDSILIKLLIGVVYGIFLGVVTISVSKKLTLKRTDDPVKAAPIDTTLFKIMAVVVGIIASCGLFGKENSKSASALYDNCSGSISCVLFGNK